MFELSSQDFQAMTAFFQDLVRTPSLSTQEREVAARLAGEMRRVGISDVRVDRIGNVIGRIGTGGDKKLLFDGHMDTVGVSDPVAWTRDPFGAEIEDGVLYGRGAADMKGALAAMVYAAKMLIDSGVSLDGDLYLVGVVQEEPCEGLAMRVLVEEEGLRPCWVVLGEPTNLQVSRGQRGRIEMRVTVQGKACHASAPHLGENAIYGAARIIFGLELVADQLTDDRLLGRGSLAVTQIESTAGSRNAVPDRCAFYIDRRLTLGETEAKALAMRVLVEEEGLRPCWVVLGEPTNLQVSRGQRGRIEMRVTVQGKACHASAPHLGENAIYGAARIIFGLELVADQLTDDRLLGRGSLAVTQIESTAGSRNAVPDRCAFYIDRRLTLGETEAKALAEVQSVILRESLRAEAEVTEYRATSYTGYETRQRVYHPAWAMEEDHPLVQATVRTVRNTLGYVPRVQEWVFSTDGVYTMGVASIPTVGFGPGEERYAHTSEEQVRLDDVAAAARVYAQLAVDLLA